MQLLIVAVVVPLLGTRRLQQLQQLLGQPQVLWLRQLQLRAALGAQAAQHHGRLPLMILAGAAIQQHRQGSGGDGAVVAVLQLPAAAAQQRGSCQAELDPLLLLLLCLVALFLQQPQQLQQRRLQLRLQRLCTAVAAAAIALDLALRLLQRPHQLQLQAHARLGQAILLQQRG